MLLLTGNFYKRDRVKKAVIYARYSSDKQTEQSIEDNFK